MLLVHHVKPTCGAYRKDHAQVKQVVLLELVDGVSIEAYTLVLLIQTVVLIDQVAKLVLDQLGLALEVLDVATDQLAEAQVLVQSRTCLIFAFQNVAEARAQSNLAPTIKDDLRTRQVRVSHVLLVQVVD